VSSKSEVRQCWSVVWQMMSVEMAGAVVGRTTIECCVYVLQVQYCRDIHVTLTCLAIPFFGVVLAYLDLSLLWTQLSLTSTCSLSKYPPLVATPSRLLPLRSGMRNQTMSFQRHCLSCLGVFLNLSISSDSFEVGIKWPLLVLISKPLYNRDDWLTGWYSFH